MVLARCLNQPVKHVMCWIVIYISILMLLTWSFLYLQLQSSDISKYKDVDRDLINLLKVAAFYNLKRFFFF